VVKYAAGHALHVALDSAADLTEEGLEARLSASASAFRPSRYEWPAGEVVAKGPPSLAAAGAAAKPPHVAAPAPPAQPPHVAAPAPPAQPPPAAPPAQPLQAPAPAAAPCGSSPRPTLQTEEAEEAASAAGAAGAAVVVTPVSAPAARLSTAAAADDGEAAAFAA